MSIAGGDDTTAGKRRNPWIWISVLCALVAVGALIWALAVRSDLDSTQQQLDSTSQELDSTKQELDTAQTSLDSTKQELESAQQPEAEEPAEPEDEDEDGRGRGVLTVGAFAAMKSVYDDLADELGATQEELEDSQQEIKDANEKAAQAEKDAAAAKEQAEQADTEVDKANAEADQAKAEAQSAQSKATVAADCARGYISAFGGLFEGDSVRSQAESVRKDFATITADCKDAFAGTS